MLSNWVAGEDSWETLGVQGNQTSQSWIFIGRTDAETEAPVLWPPDVRSQLIRKDPNVGKDWRQEKRAAEDEMFGWHHQFDAHKLGQTPGDVEGQEGLACCSSWGFKGSDTIGNRTTTVLLASHLSNSFWSTEIDFINPEIFLELVPEGASQVAKWVKNLLSMQELQETWIWSPGQEDALEVGMATHSSILPGESHRQKSLVGYSP